MPELNFEERVRNSFLRVKEDINNLENQIKGIKEILKLQQEQIELILQKIDKISQYNTKEASFNTNSNHNSIGNEGVCASMHASMQAPVHINTRENSQNKANFDSISTVDKLFLTLTKKEFLVLLSIYQLEDDIGNVTYEDLSKHLSVTEGCVRSHIVSLVKKGLPIIRNKINNRITILSISSEFRNLGIKARLFNLYSQQDPTQKKLF